MCGTADQLNYELIIRFGVFWFLSIPCDRNNLFASLSEADRVLKKGGFLAITDFDPGVNCKRPYIHKAGIYSYKQDYSRFYTETGLYYLFEKKAFSHRQAFFDFNNSEKFSLTILYKEVDPYPLDSPEMEQ